MGEVNQSHLAEVNWAEESSADVNLTIQGGREGATIQGGRVPTWPAGQSDRPRRVGSGLDYQVHLATHPLSLAQPPRAYYRQFGQILAMFDKFVPLACYINGNSNSNCTKPTFPSLLTSNQMKFHVLLFLSNCKTINGSSTKCAKLSQCMFE